MTATSTETGSADLPSLVPAPTRWRNALLVVAAVGAVTVAWISPDLLRPTVGPVENGVVHAAGGGASWAHTLDQLVTTVELEPEAFGPLDVVAVSDVSGAEMLGAWVVPNFTAGGTPLQTWADSGSTEPFPGQAGALPQTIQGVDDPALEILWQITDCEKLDPAEGLGVTVQTSYGLTSTSTFGSVPARSPGQIVAEDWFADICP